MNVMTKTVEQIPSSVRLNIPDGARILIVCDDDSETKRLSDLLLEAGFDSVCVQSMTKGCEAAKSGQFQVIVSAPALKDGTWRRFTKVAKRYGLHFEVVLWARKFDLREWVKALNDGAFDVLDAVSEQARAVEATKCAFWAAYLKGADPHPAAVRQHHQVA